MALMQTVRNTLRRWDQLRTLRRYFARQSMVSRPCPLCEARTTRTLVRGDRDFIGIHTAQCECCGFIFSSPYYPERVIADFYREGYRTLFKGQPDPRALTARQTYLSERAAFYSRWLEEQHILPGAGGRVLDVGCGEGTLLRALQAGRRPLALMGVEPTVAYAEHVSTEDGITVVGEISDLSPDLRFDLIVSIHVLEHVYDPVGLLSRIRDRLGDGGVCYIDVPDVAAYASISDLHLAHCNHFSAHTLGAALERAGFAVRHVIRHRPPTLPPSLFAIAVHGGLATTAQEPRPDPAGPRIGRQVAAIDVRRISFLKRSARELMERRRAARRHSTRGSGGRG
jgi:2-polyprenyl-3-methyl-5-hydroxy-6-metoxy-1,4-benzoquinol methylase